MTTTYTPAERLAEQIDILLRDPGPTEIVLLSMLGEPALPRLCAKLDADTRGKREWRHAVAVIRVLGMSGHPSVVPSLALRLSTYKQEGYSRDETEPRALAHALRKVGNDEALRVLIDNLPRVDLAHMRAMLEPFGDRARDALVAKMARFDDPAWLEAAKLVTAMRLPQGIPLLVQAAGHRLDAHRLLAHYGPDAPKDWAVRRLLDIRGLMMEEYIKAKRPRSSSFYGHVEESPQGLHPEHDALLAILYHAGDPAVLPHLAPYLKLEQLAGLTRMTGEPPASVTLLALALGDRALPHLAEEAYAHAGAEAAQAVRDIRARIQENLKHRAEAEAARRRGWGHERDGAVRAPAFKLAKSPLGDEEADEESDPLPSRRAYPTVQDEDDD